MTMSSAKNPQIWVVGLLILFKKPVNTFTRYFQSSKDQKIVNVTFNYTLSENMRHLESAKVCI